MRATADVLVVGGGPAGLTAALLAARAGHQVVLLESSERLGGMAASIDVLGQQVDLGSHRLHPAMSPKVRLLLEELLGDDLQVRTRNGRLRLADRWVSFPLRTGELLRRLPVGLSSRIAGDLATGALRREGPDDSYADVVRARLGATVLRHFHGPYARKLYGVDAEQLDGSLARRRIALTGMGDVARTLRRTSAPEGRTFLYPRLGYGQIVDRLAEAAIDAGVTIQSSRRPVGITPGVGSVSVRSSDGGQVQAGRVLWTAPAASLAAVAGQPTPPFMRRGVALVYTVLNQAEWTPFDAHYVPDPDVLFVRISEPKRYRDGPDPAGTTVVCAEIPCQVDDAIWTMEDSDLMEAVRAGIRRLDLPDPVPQAHHVVRLPSVYPLIPRGWAKEHRSALADVDGLEGVTLVGRQALEVADNLHHVMQMAISAVECLAPGGVWDDDRWARARRSFDEFVIED